MNSKLSWNHFNEVSVSFRKIMSISFNREDGFDAHGWRIKIVLNSENKYISCECIGCFGVNISELFSSPAVELKVLDVKGDQIEGASYKIIDREGGEIEFMCQSLAFSYLEAI